MACITKCQGCGAYVTRRGLCDKCKGTKYDEVVKENRYFEQRIKDLESQVASLLKDSKPNVRYGTKVNN